MWIKLTRRNLFRVFKLIFLLLLFYPLVAFIDHVLARPPRRVTIRANLEPGKFLIESDFLIFMTENGPLAVSRRCTHLGCRLTFVEEEKNFICPCHHSRFNWDGRYISGPARKNLTRYKVKRIKKDVLLVEIPSG